MPPKKGLVLGPAAGQWINFTIPWQAPDAHEGRHSVANADLKDQLQAALGATYTLVRELGRGGMATVFLALDAKHGRSVALKVLHPDLAASLGPERFRREISFAAQLQHPHILIVMDSGESRTGSSGSRCPMSKVRRCASGSDASDSCRSTTPYGSATRSR